MGKSSGQTVTSSQSLDPQTQAWISQVFGAAQGAAGRPAPGVDGLTTQAIGGFQNQQRAGNLGLGALAGDEGAMSRLMNPYQSQVIDRVLADQGRVNALTQNSVNDAATSAGAFGGSRHGIASGVALGEANRATGDRLADLHRSGFGDMMGRATQLASMGESANNALGIFGDYRRNVQLQNQTRSLDILKNSLMGLPFGTTTTQHMEQKSNPWNTALGLGSMFFGLGGGGLLSKLGGKLGFGMPGLLGGNIAGSQATGEDEY